MKLALQCSSKSIPTQSQTWTSSLPQAYSICFLSHMFIYTIQLIWCKQTADTTRQNQVLHHNNATTVWILIHMSSKTCIWNHFSIRITDTQCVWLLLVRCCHSQNRELTWACPRPRTWDAAIRSLFWLAYDEEGRDGIHDRGWREGGDRTIRTTRKVYSYTKKPWLHRADQRNLTSTRVCPSKASMP